MRRHRGYVWNSSANYCLAATIKLTTTGPSFNHLIQQRRSESVQSFNAAVLLALVASGETGKEDGRENELKPFVAVQGVRLPPGKGAARQPEASLARVRQRHA